MPWSGGTFSRNTGVFTGNTAWAQTEAAARDILSSDHDVHDSDLSTGINTCLTKDGQNIPTADLPMGAFKHTGVGDAAARTNYASAGQIADNALLYAGTSSGTDTITASLSPAITAYVTGQKFSFKAGGTNTGACTINFNSVGAKSIKKGGDGATDPYAGDITTGGIYDVEYDGTNFQLLNPKTPTGFGSGDNPTFGTVSISSTDTTISRTGAGDIAVEGNAIYRAGGTDVPVADGGNGRSTATAYAVICGGTTSTAAHQSIASVGTAGQVLTSNGAGALPTFQTLAWTYASEVNTLSGTALTLVSGLPSTVSEIEIMLRDVSTSGVNVTLIIQIGDSGGFETTGYTASAESSVVETSTEGMQLNTSGAYDAGNVAYGTVRLTKYNNAQESWNYTSHLFAGGVNMRGVGYKVLSEAITQVQITTTAGTPTFDAGTISLRYR